MKNLNREDFKELVFLIYTFAVLMYFFLVTFFPPEQEAGQRFADIILGALVGLLLKLTADYFGNNGEHEDEMKKRIEKEIKEKYGLTEETELP
jgi:hypothetical protein